MDNSNPKLTQLLELVNTYPSPHNGQPIRIQINNNSFELYFEKNRGLQAADVSYIFSFVSMGIFVEFVKNCAQALGHSVSFTVNLPKEADLKGNGVVKFADCKIKWNVAEPNKELLNAIHFRQTSRKKYKQGVDDQTAQNLINIATTDKMNLKELNKEQGKQAIWLNQRAVFDDMFDEAVRRELDHWLRYSKAEKDQKRDGLSYDCMELNGGLLKFIVNHPKILRAPLISPLIKQYYLRTMMDASRVFYMLAPFGNETDSFNVGKVIMDIWMEVSKKGYYLHPFGTIMSNHAAHQDFVKMADIENESRQSSYLVFIFRCGKSEPPAKSLRIPYDQHLIMESV